MSFINRCGGGGSAKLQTKTATPSTSQVVVTPDSGYDGLDKVTVSGIKLQSKSVSPSTSDKNVSPDSDYDGLSSVTVNGIELTSKTVTPSTEQQVVIPGAGYDGLGSVTVEGDSDLIAGNIKSGINIFGVTGSFAGSYEIGECSFIVNTLTSDKKYYVHVPKTVFKNGCWNKTLKYMFVIKPNSTTGLINFIYDKTGEFTLLVSQNMIHGTHINSDGDASYWMGLANTVDVSYETNEMVFSFNYDTTIVTNTDPDVGDNISIIALMIFEN